MAEDRISALLADALTVVALRPWPRYEVDTTAFEAIAQALGDGEREMLALWADTGMVHMALRRIGEAPCVVSTAVIDGRFPSVGCRHAPAIRPERAIRDLYGYEPVGAPDLRPWLDHGAWTLAHPLGSRGQAVPRDPADYDMLPVVGEGLHQIPVGPVHAGIIEPGHFRFTANGETVVRLEERLGYVHKGIDVLTTNVPVEQAAKVVARVSGDSTVAASFAYALAVEAALGIEVPRRAAVIRGVMAELERLANHFGDIGAICNDAAFAIMLAHCGIYRERILAASAAVFAHRLMMDTIVPGGVTTNVTAEGARLIAAALDEISPAFDEIVRLYEDTPSIQDRTCGTGHLAADLAVRFAAGGPVGRASARDFDARRDLAYAPYAGRDFEVPVLTAGDVDARVQIRIREVAASMKMIREWLRALPVGPILAPVPDAVAPCEGIAVTEAFRGDLLVWLRLLPGRKVARCHVRDASWFQWPLLEAAIEGNIVADFPLCNKSFNCSYSGHDL
ncbi:hydrogenase expression protein HypE [Rhodoplanes roseus]|uniref:Hydrogenase expression protein HypE n=1 Tax=Rhodoplanes roseus TaxID=29409 RepID=A0A327L7S6_9BRAD|nr:hydrogenase expression protein HypE [Rhodoplanes roseus]RAI46115.1 hydrogenase expression protein HypE [Rhodoplanes roseus]